MAELSLADIDRALKDHGIEATRFVDDFRLFLGSGEEPYDVLAFLAEQLAVNEGLSLNAAKTKAVSRSEYLRSIRGMTSDIAEEAQGAAMEALTADLYFEDEPDPDDIESLAALNLLEFLDNELSEASPDPGRVKVIFRALKITRPEAAIGYISSNLK